MTKYLDLDIVTINQKLKNKEFTVSDLVKESLEKIKNNKQLNAIITLCEESALKAAKELDEKEVDNILFGIPIVVKDNILVKDILCTAGSKMLENFIAPYDAFVVEKIKENNMIIVGKSNMDEFAMGSASDTSYFGSVKNYWDLNKTAGGSSGGSASIVASNSVFMALGSDTGGSIRQPASFCKIVGMKPTYGNVSRYGLMSFSSSLDQIGPMTRTVYENALLLNAIAKYDDRDMTSVKNNEDYTRLIGEDVVDLKIAIPNYFMSDKVSDKVKEKIKEVELHLASRGVKIDYVDIEHLNLAYPLYQTIGMGEASSNLARYDGVKFGLTNDLEYDNYYEYIKDIRTKGFGEEVKKRIMTGTYLLSGTNAQKYYHKALVLRNEMAKSFRNIFETYDLIIGPTTRDSAFNLGETADSFDDDLAIPVNMCGLPAISIPIGNYGLQIIANHFNEAIIYKLASYLEGRLD